MEKVKRLLFIAALFGAGCIGVTAANDVSELAVVGSVTGRITDAEHRVLPGATIMIEELHTGVTSDMNGFYKLPNLKPGTYEVKISYVGFQPIVAKIYQQAQGAANNGGNGGNPDDGTEFNQHS